MPYLKVGNAQRPEIIEKDNENVLEVWCKDSLVDPGLGNNTLIWKASEEFEIDDGGSCTTFNCASYIEANKEYESTSRFTLTFTGDRGLIETGDLTVYDEVTINVAPGVQISGSRGASSGSNGGDAFRITDGSAVTINNAGRIYGAGGNGGVGGNGKSTGVPASEWGGHRACYTGPISGCVPVQSGVAWHLDQRWTKKSNGGWAWQSTQCSAPQTGSNSQYGTWGNQADTTLQSGHPHYTRIKFSYSCGSGLYSLYYQTPKTVTFVRAIGGAGGKAAGCNGSLSGAGGGGTGYLSGSGFSSVNGLNISTSSFPTEYNNTKSGAGGPAGGWGQNGSNGSNGYYSGGSGGTSGQGIRIISGSIVPGSSTGDVLPAI